MTLTDFIEEENFTAIWRLLGVKVARTPKCQLLKLLVRGVEYDWGLWQGSISSSTHI
jgi:hypothetical protein